jgi:hypothetical protein
MVNHTGAKRKVHIGGTIDSDVAEWLMKTKGKEKFSAHLNDILRGAMGGRGQKESRGGTTSMSKFNSTIDTLHDRIRTLQNRVESIEAGMGVEPKAVAEKRPRGRPRKAKPAEEPSGPYDVHADIDWYMSHDKYKKVKPQPMENAFAMVMREFEKGGDLTVGTLKADYDQAGVGVPYPTFKLFYFPLIRDRLVSKGIIQKVEHAGKKGVYRKN